MRKRSTYIDGFWEEFNGKPGRKTGNLYSPEMKLALLIKWSKVKIDNPIARTSRRKNFDFEKNNYRMSRRYGFCFVCLGRANVRHHIVSLKNGGDNSSRNIVKLCNGCHAKIHPWLARR